jgi:hypothetical protein
MHDKEMKEAFEQRDKIKRMRLTGAEMETLPHEEFYYRNQLKTIASEKARYGRAQNGLMAKLSSKRAANIRTKLNELEGAEIEAKKRLQYIDKRKREDEEARTVSELGSRQLERKRKLDDMVWEKRRAQMEKEGAEIQRQAEREQRMREKMREKWGGVRDDLRMNRMIKRRRK